MIAELYHKINNTNSNLHDQSEDELTGNFFGHMRYLPFDKGMQPVLSQGIYPHTLASYIDPIHLKEWSQNISFWPRYAADGKRTEIDVVIELEKLIIGIEVKYMSGLSSDDGLDYSIDEQRESCHQLAREARLLCKIGKEKEKLLILVAPEIACHEVYTDTMKRKLVNKVQLGYLSWQSILKYLNELQGLNVYEQLIVSDLVELLKQKGFEQFNDFSLETMVKKPYWHFEAEHQSAISFGAGMKQVGRQYYEFG